MAEEGAVVQTVQSILQHGDLQELTERRIRQLAEEALRLPPKTLSQQPYKSLVKQAVETHLASLSSNKIKVPEPVAAAAGGTLKASKKPLAQSSTSLSKTDKKAKQASAISSEFVHSSEDENTRHETDKSHSRSKQPLQSPNHIKSTKKVKVASTDAPGGTADVSEAEGKKIKQLQGYIAKCGVRKVWGKEFKGLNGKQRIERLWGILNDLGIHGKPSIEKCNEIRKKREWEQEQADLDLSNILPDDAKASRRSRVVTGITSSTLPTHSDKDKQEVSRKRRVIDSDSDE